MLVAGHPHISTLPDQASTGRDTEGIKDALIVPRPSRPCTELVERVENALTELDIGRRRFNDVEQARHGGSTFPVRRALDDDDPRALVANSGATHVQLLLPPPDHPMTLGVAPRPQGELGRCGAVDADATSLKTRAEHRVENGRIAGFDRWVQRFWMPPPAHRFGEDGYAQRN